MINKTILKSLPLLTLLTAGLVLSPTMAMAGHGDRSHSKGQYSHDDRQSHSKGHKRSNKHSNKVHYKSHGKSHKGNYGRSSKHHYTEGHGHKRGYNNHRYNHHDRHRGHHTTYVVNDHHYNDYLYGLDHLGFMIGLHTNNFDITFRD